MSPQTVAVGCDHGGFPLKQIVLQAVEALGLRALDCGTDSERPVDYPDFASEVTRRILDGEAERGIVICGSGVGASVAANKVDGIRAGLCHDCYSARQAVEHDDINVLCLGARVVGSSLAIELVRAFLQAEFTGEERHERRKAKVLEMERTRRPL